MKKYVKPELFYEHFELSQHIADCAWELTEATDKSNCRAEADSNLLGGGMPALFMEAGKGCVLLSGNYESYCYHTGKDGMPHVFMS